MKACQHTSNVPGAKPLPEIFTTLEMVEHGDCPTMHPADYVAGLRAGIFKYRVLLSTETKRVIILKGTESDSWVEVFNADDDGNPKNLIFEGGCDISDGGNVKLPDNAVDFEKGKKYLITVSYVVEM